MSTESGWIVLLREPKLEDPAPARDCLVAVLKLNRLDAMMQARHAYGILAEGLGQGEATQLAHALTGKGVQADAVDLGNLPRPIPGTQVHNADAIDKGLVVQGLHGEDKGTLPWGRVAVVSVGSIRQGRRAERSRGDAYAPVVHASGARLSRHGPRTQYKAQAPILRVHVLTDEPIYELRFSEHQMNYDYLGPRVQPSAGGNFRMFVTDLVTYGKEAWIADSVRSFLERAHPPRHEFDEDDFARYNRWHLCMAMLRRQGSG